MAIGASAAINYIGHVPEAGSWVYRGNPNLGGVETEKKIPENWEWVVETNSSPIEVQAYIKDSSVAVGDRITLTSNATQTIKSLVAAASASLGVGGVAGVGAAGSGAAAKNVIASNVKAYIDGDGIKGITSVYGVKLDAKNQSKIDADVGAVAVAIGAGGVAGVGVSIGISLAKNVINNAVEAYIANADNKLEATGGTVQVNASSDSTIKARSIAASLAVGAAGIAGVGVSAAGAFASNTILGQTKAYIDNSIILASTNVDVTAKDKSSINAEIVSASAAAGFGLVGVAVSIGLSYAENKIGYEESGGEWVYVGPSDKENLQEVEIKEARKLSGDGKWYVDNQGRLLNGAEKYVNSEGKFVNASGGLLGILVSPVGGQFADRAINKEYIKNKDLSQNWVFEKTLKTDSAGTAAYINDSDVTTTSGDVVVKADSEQTINAEIKAFSASLAGGLVGVAVAGSGSLSKNYIGTATIASISGKFSTGINARAVTVQATNSSTITSVTSATSISAAIGLVGVGVSIGVSLAENTISSVTHAFIANTSIQTTLGGLTVKAVENSTVNATATGTSVAAAAGLVGVAVSVAGANANNIILTDTQTYITGSELNTIGNVIVDADNTATINAEIESISTAVSIGLVGVSAAIGSASASNVIGRDLSRTWDGETGKWVYSDADSSGFTGVQSYIDGTTINAANNVTITADNTATINADIKSESLAISAGLIATAASAAITVSSNKSSATVRAFIRSTTVPVSSRLGGSINVIATDNATITSTGSTASVAKSIGVIANSASVGLNVSKNTLDNKIESYITSSTLRVRDDINVEAKENATVNTKAAASSLSESAGIGLALSNAGVFGSSTIAGTVKAYVESSTLDASDDISVKAEDSKTIIASVLSVAKSSGLISMAGAGVDLNANITTVVDAHISSSTINADELKVLAESKLYVEAKSFSFSAGTLAVGSNNVSINVTPTITAALGGTVTANSLSVQASLNKQDSHSYITDILAVGLAGGGLVGGQSTLATSKVDATVTSTIQVGSTLTVSGAIGLSANNQSVQNTNVNGFAVGGLASIGASHAKVTSNSTVKAVIANNVKIQGGSLNVAAIGIDGGYADAKTMGAAGIAGLAGGLAQNKNTSTVLVEIGSAGSGRNIVLSGNFNAESSHTAVFDSRVSALAVGALLGGAGAIVSNSVNANVQTNILDSANISAGSIAINAKNVVQKNKFSTNIAGTTGGLLAGAILQSRTDIDLTTLVNIGNSTKLNQTAYDGELLIKAFNDITAFDKVSAKMVGLVALAAVESSIDIGKDIARVTIGDNARLDSKGIITLAARGTGNVGATTGVDVISLVSGTLLKSVVYYNPINEILVGNGATINSGADFYALAGIGKNVDRDDYRVKTRTDVISKSAIPLDKMDAVFLMEQVNTVKVGSGANLDVGGDAKLYLITRNSQPNLAIYSV